MSSFDFDQVWNGCFDQAWNVLKITWGTDNDEDTPCERCGEAYDGSGVTDDPHGICEICRHTERQASFEDAEIPVDEAMQIAEDDPKKWKRDFQEHGMDSVFDGSFKPFPPEAEEHMDEGDALANQRHREETDNMAILGRILGVSAEEAVAEFERVKQELFGDREP